MRVIFVDGANKHVSEKNVDGSLQGYYDLIECHVIEAVQMENGDIMYVDEEGLLRDDGAIENFFIHHGAFAPTPLAGNGVIIGVGEMGNATEPISTLEEAIEQVQFLTVHEFTFWR